MAFKVSKFGGTSTATRAQLEKCLDIILSDEDRRFAVFSAPGARFDGDIKVTDLLKNAAQSYLKTGSIDNSIYREIMSRYEELIPEDVQLLDFLDKKLSTNLRCMAIPNYLEVVMASGEEDIAFIASSVLTRRGIDNNLFDTKKIGFLIEGEGDNRSPHISCYERMRKYLLRENHRVGVVTGYYGVDEKGNLTVLPRGGCDTSGTAVARAVGAEICENYTDEDGLKRAHPKIVHDAETIPKVTRREIRALTYMGFKLQDRCLMPLIGTNIVLNVRNTNNPSHLGTMIVDFREVNTEERIVGVACVKANISIDTVKYYIEDDVGYGRTFLQQIENAKVPYEHTPDDVDGMSVVLDEAKLRSRISLEELVQNIKDAVNPDEIGTTPVAIMSLTGLGIANHFDVEYRAAKSLADQKIKLLVMDKGPKSLSIVLGVSPERAADAVRAVYYEFFPRK
jgi:aspartate kinase